MQGCCKPTNRMQKDLEFIQREIQILMFEKRNLGSEEWVHHEYVSALET